MNSQLYAVKEVLSYLYIRPIDSREAAALLLRSGLVLLATPADLDALAASRGKLLYSSALHAEDAPLGQPRSLAGSSAA
ncbi:MAG: hypothetical protein NTV86_18225 [Planctomycetota bacterium]|nr:hypothetical protein [Planctomycetota bacterium]